MATSLRKRHVGAEQRRALRLLASIPFGAARAVMRAHGFTRRTLADLVYAGLATAEHTTGKGRWHGDRGWPHQDHCGRPQRARRLTDRLRLRQSVTKAASRARYSIARFLGCLALRS